MQRRWSKRNVIINKLRKIIERKQYLMKSWMEISEEELVFTLPLYRKVEIDWLNMVKKTVPQVDRGYEYNEYVTYMPEEFVKLVNFIGGSGDIYGTCPHCKKGMSFKIGRGLDIKLKSNVLSSYVDAQVDLEDSISDDVEEMRETVNDISNKARFFERKFQCPICKSIYQVSYRILFEKDKLYLMKIGQYPSLHEFSEYSLNAYDKLLKKMDARDDFRNAIKMHTDGYNIAAYVYLRRVVEKIILFVYNDNKGEIDCEYEGFKNLHLDQKIQIIKEFLPKFLYSNQQIYSIVSAGIHMLDEETCEQYFDILQTAVEIILSEYETNRKKRILLQKTSNEIKNAHNKISSKLK